MNWLSNNEQEYLHDAQLKLAIVKNINTPIELLLKFYETSCYNKELLLNSIKEKIIKLDDLDYLKKLFIKYEDDKNIIEAISKNKIVDKELVYLVFRNYTGLVTNLIDNGKLSLDEIVEINENSSYGLKDYTYKYLQNYVAKIDDAAKLDKLMNYTSKDLNYFIAQNNYISEDLFNILALSDDFRTRAVIANRIDTPIEILYSFIDDSSDTVRLALAKNINIDKRILSYLATDNKVTIIKEVINHLKTDKNILNLIVSSDNASDNVRKLAIEQLEKLDNLNVDSNIDYYDIIEMLKLNQIDKIELHKKENMDNYRKKIIVKLED